MLHHIYSGQLFLTSAAILALIALIDAVVRIERPAAQSVARVVALLATSLAVLSATPVPLGLAVPAVLLALAYVFLGVGVDSPRRAAIALAAAVAAIGCLVHEARWHAGKVELQRPVRLVVLGDSLSSGGFGETTAWPDLLAARVKCEVVNLARPGDTTSGAVGGQLPDVPAARAGDLVFVEIGGNDMLEGIGARAFAGSLEELSGSLVDGRRVVMFELPLLPGRWGYGAAQRRMAREKGVTLVPKRVLAGVLLGDGNTSDGLHLTQQGHDALANAVAEWAGW